MSTTKTVDDLRGAEYVDTRDVVEVATAIREEVECEDPRELSDDEAALLDFDDGMSSEIEDYRDGATMIRRDHFEEYARELAEDTGAISSDAQWPLYCIDWERAASDLAVDYSSVAFLGYDYYVRG